MSSPEDVELPSGADLKNRWKALSRDAQGQVARNLRRGETSKDEHEALLIAAMAKQRLNEWTLRPEIVIPAFVGVFALLALVWDGFSFGSSLMAPVIYAGYMILMRIGYRRAYRRSIEVLREERRRRA